MHKFIFALRNVFLTMLSLALAWDAFAVHQNRDTLLSRRLDSLTVKGRYSGGTSQLEKFSKGTKVLLIDSSAIEQGRTESLAALLKRESALYIKEYGRGMGAYLSVRGTSSSHTTITWNGLSLDFPTMGQADFSHIPLYFFDKMAVSVGGSSAFFGDGALGGALTLETSPVEVDGFSGDIHASLASYETYTGGATLRYGGKRFGSRTSIYGNRALNNYKFTNNTVEGLPVERLNNSSVSSYGALQELFYRFGESHEVGFNLLYLDFDRDIQPSVSNNSVPTSYASIYDNSLRLSAWIKGGGAALKYNTRVAYSKDRQKYKRDVIAADKVNALAELEFPLRRGYFRAGISGTYTKPEVESYAAGTEEWRGSLFGMIIYRPVEPVELSLGVRYTSVTDMTVPVMPSTGVKVRILSSPFGRLFARASLSGNAKVPSLNDRYWGGEHLYLKAERSTTIEGGADYILQKGLVTLTTFFTLYRSDVDDWIRWLPAGSVWRPQNVPNVLSKGAEAGVKLAIEAPAIKYELSANYNYTNISMKRALWDQDPGIGQQLAYQPKNSFSVNLSADTKRLRVWSSTQYTGSRTTVDIFDKLPGYSVTDAGISYKMVLAGNRSQLSFTVNNIFNKDYQNVKFYAMPMRNWQLVMKINF